MHRTLLSLTISLVLIGQIAQAQSSISRLTGTKKESYLSTTGWMSYDSSRYVYSTFGTKHHTPYYSDLHPELVGRLPLYDGSDAQYYYTGMFSVGSEALLLFNQDSWMADSLVWYTPDIHKNGDDWSIDEIMNRSFERNHIDSSYYLYSGNAPLYLTIEYNNNDQPTKELIKDNSSTTMITLDHSSIGFIGFAVWRDQYGALRKTVGTSYTLDENGRPVEEIQRDYDASMEENPGQITARITYSYAPSGLVSNKTLYTTSAEGYISTDSFNYYYNNNILKQYLILHREVDTTITPAEIGAWDTSTVVDLYFSGDRIDSLVRRNTDYGDTDLEFDLRELFTYTGDLLTTYRAYYYSINTVYKYDEITHYYDADNRLSKISWFNETATYCSQIDTVYSYNDFDQVTLKEIFEKTNYDNPCAITEPEATKRYHYYYEEIPVAGESAAPLIMQVFPSPADNTLTIQIVNSSGSVSDQLIRVTDIFGQLVYSETLPASATYQAINCSTWASGLYIVALEQDGLLAKQKIIVK